MGNKKYFSIGLVLAIIGLGLITALALAATTNASTSGHLINRGNGTRGIGQGIKPAIVGTVSSINGNSIIVTGKQGFAFGQRNKATSTQPVSSITYTVDASSATVMKNNATSSISNIVVGDTILVQGTVSGTSITATLIRDGIMNNIQGKMQNQNGDQRNFASSTFQGNGQPVIAGTISAINGSTITVTNKSNVTYTIDATNAKITDKQNTVTISNLTVGNNVMIQGTVNGNLVTASSIITQVNQANTNAPAKKSVGFFGAIGNFFKNLFGF